MLKVELHGIQIELPETGFIKKSYTLDGIYIIFGMGKPTLELSSNLKKYDTDGRLLWTIQPINTEPQEHSSFLLPYTWLEENEGQLVVGNMSGNQYKLDRQTGRVERIKLEGRAW